MKNSHFLRTAAQFLLPNHCFLCSAPDADTLCKDCLQELPTLQQQCECCALPLAAQGICGECLQHRPSFEHCFCPFVYAGQIPTLINQFKHHSQRQLGERLASCLGELLQRQGTWKKSILLPVPLHWRGLLKRGYNQAEVIANQLAKQLNIPVVTGLHKQLNRQHQQDLNRRQRLRNSRELYSVKRDVSEQNILLVDDVMTTGATLEAISAALIQAGANRVIACTLARTPKNRGG